MSTVALLAPANGATTIVSGRTYTGTAGTIINAPDFDSGELESNGWLPVTGNAAHATGTTAQRPARPKKGDKYADSTLGLVVLFDGQTWRHTLTGAST